MRNYEFKHQFCCNKNAISTLLAIKYTIASK